MFSFIFEEFELDKECSEHDQEIYNELLERYSSKNKNSEIKDSSILFIISMKHTLIPNYYKSFSMIADAIHNDYSSLYILKFNKDDVNVLIEPIIDSLNDRNKIEINFEKSNYLKFLRFLILDL